jgi:type II secretory ATPase GspE/PulE/Tfp pilus assembly ATPase PilB-like protein
MSNLASLGPSSVIRLGEKLLADNLVTPDQLELALAEQERTGKMLGEVLSSLGFVAEDVLRDLVATALGWVPVEMSKIVADPAALKLINKPLALRHTIFPLSFDPQTKLLSLATSRPHDILASDQIRAQLSADIQIEWRLASAPDILTCIEQFYGQELSISGILHEIDTGQMDQAALGQTMDSYQHPVVRLINALLRDAVLRGASDIHLEPENKFLRVRYRIDGVLRQILVLHIKHWPAMLVRLKVIANMDIAESRDAQDGRVSLGVAGRTVDFRVAVQPTLHGENFVLRILDRQRKIAGIREMGLAPSQLKLLEQMLARPEGIMLVTGPTGSGKTTTLYSILNHLNHSGVNIMTLEDPVEYPLAIVRQTAIGATSKMSFSDGIRSLMRQDPDIILLGEMRDKETTEMAFRAAMTGHQVFSTLHTNSAIRSIPRLLDMGVEPEIMCGNMIGIIAQRLVRLLCVHCREAVPPDDELKLLLKGQDIPATVYRAKGCLHCEYQGYKGRIPLIEILKFDSGIDELVQRRSSLNKMNEHALAHGFVPLYMDGLRRVREGLTTLDEVRRVVEVTVMSV